MQYPATAYINYLQINLDISARALACSFALNYGPMHAVAIYVYACFTRHVVRTQSARVRYTGQLVTYIYGIENDLQWQSGRQERDWRDTDGVQRNNTQEETHVKHRPETTASTPPNQVHCTLGLGREVNNATPPKLRHITDMFEKKGRLPTYGIQDEISRRCFLLIGLLIILNCSFLWQQVCCDASKCVRASIIRGQWWLGWKFRRAESPTSASLAYPPQSSHDKNSWRSSRASWGSMGSWNTSIVWDLSLNGFPSLLCALV